MINKAAIQLFAIASLLILGCGKRQSEEDSPQKPVICDKGCGDTTAFGILTPTVYHIPTVVVASAASCDMSEYRPVLDPKGRELTVLCSDDYWDCVLNGSCYVKSYRNFTINFHSEIDKTYRFFELNSKICQTALGASGECLRPFYSIAADWTFHPKGTQLYIPILDGVLLPTGEYHNGIVRVSDTGGAIKGFGRFDFFVGTYEPFSGSNPFTNLGISDPNYRFDFFIHEEEESQTAQATNTSEQTDSGS